MLHKRLFLLPALLLVLGCASQKTTVDVASPPATSAEETTPPLHPHRAYRASRPLDMKIQHTKLYLKPDFKKAWMYGTAYLTVTPHFYHSNELVLDAKGFVIERVELVGDDFFKPLPYTYDDLQLNIKLDYMYAAGTPIKILIQYIAKPNERQNIGGSAAIQSDKGLYFINGDSSDAFKPIQMWTQGETESNSCWYPTIDAPNQKTSQEIYITVDSAFVTLSNGELVYSTDNGDGTRTDYWSQKLAHAPYLTMLAVGDFAVQKETWRGKEVSYYVEPEFGPYAKDIYPNTVPMLEFFSEQLGVPYPWDKYAQISVRDYVSGAMENTGAVIFGEWAQRTPREMLDGDAESTVAHELFHHWFGDLVTCESWSNLSINESFATYGSYLWDEHQYGQMEADQGLYGNLQGYLNESKRKQVDLVRFYYDDKEQMFDSHSYAKGSRILHMLRKEVGDKAFFASLKLFLTRHAHEAVEVHQLRLAFEEVTGRDLNWFFNQWFFASGHPILDIDYGYDAETGEVTVRMKQQPSGPDAPLYRLPMLVDIYTGDSKTTHPIVFMDEEHTFRFKSERPVLVNADAQKMLLCDKRENKTDQDFITQFRRAPLFLDQYEALLALRSKRSDATAKAVFDDALQHEFWYFRSFAIEQFNHAGWEKDQAYLAKLAKIAASDEKSDVRAAAFNKLAKARSDKFEAAFRAGVEQDSSFRVVAAALKALSNTQPDTAVLLACALEPYRAMAVPIAELYAMYGDVFLADFFERNFETKPLFTKVRLIQQYSALAQRLEDDMFTHQVIKFIDDAYAQNKNRFFARVVNTEKTKLQEMLGIHEN